MEGKYKHYLKILPDNIIKVLSECNTMLAGGSCLSLIQRSVGVPSSFNDLDFYFETEEDYQITYNKLQEEKNRMNNAQKLFSYDYQTEFAYTMVIDGEEIQLIKIFKPFKETIADFDIENSKCWSFYPFDNVQTNIDTKTLTTELQIKSTTKNIGLVSRMLKYKSKKGLNISNYYDLMFDTLRNYETAEYSSSYAGEIKNRKYFVAHLIETALDLPGFDKYLEEKENQIFPEILPFHLLQGAKSANITRLINLKSLMFYQANPSDEVKDWMKHYFPERLL